MQYTKARSNLYIIIIIIIIIKLLTKDAFETKHWFAYWEDDTQETCGYGHVDEPTHDTNGSSNNKDKTKNA